MPHVAGNCEWAPEAEGILPSKSQQKISSSLYHNCKEWKAANNHASKAVDPSPSGASKRD